MSRFFLAVFLFTVLLFANSVWALPGVAPPGEALAEYDYSTGEITVSFTDVLNWYIEDSDGDVMTGDAPVGLPTSGGLVSDNDARIGESSFLPFSVTDLNLGSVATDGLFNDGSMKILWNTGLGLPLEEREVNFPGIPKFNHPPEAIISRHRSINIAMDSLSTTLNAGMSSDLEGDLLSYMWDLDDDGMFEVDTGLAPILEILDVTETFGENGIYPISVEVFDGYTADVATMSLRIYDQFYVTPPPPTPPYTLVDALYSAATGEISVEVDGVINWYIESASGSLTGDTPLGLPVSSGLTTDNNVRIGETALSPFSYEVDLGSVAAVGLPADDLRVFWNEGLGTPFWSQPVAYGVANPEPSSLVLVGVGLLGLGCFRRRWGGAR